ncbi:hypothetical protein H0E87_028213 [Populus deltoides]|uniref:Uncharacterized protein n=1 Tax=Populus deltoides TaxID=3696 RepID=A0A8T2WSH9_POPDE|nr:hypothetical protein H0E87_028213 [Populus deltoides]
MDALVLRQIGFKIILHDAVDDGKLVLLEIPTGAAWEIELFKSITNDMEPDVEGQLQEPLTEEAHDDVSFQIITISPTQENKREIPIPMSSAS